eukprot:PITA_15759
MFLLQKRLKHIKLGLKEWNKKEFGNIFEEKEIVEGNMHRLNQTLITEGFDKERNELEIKYHQDWDNLCKQEEFFWRQKSRVQWLKEGDRNTGFFHKATMSNRAHNRISTIKDKKGPDGFNVDFFKACWNIVKQDILSVVEDSRKDKTILKALNTTFIALIPKQDVALIPDRFRPIALCNVVFKIISRVVANRLKPLLPTLVVAEQSGYVERRQILDNIIQAHEVVHSLTNNKRAGMIMQLDIAKAYDKLN